MYTLGIQLKVAKVLFTNPDRYAHISVHPEGKDEELKKEPSLKTLFSYLEKTCHRHRERSDGKRSLLAQFADLEESDDDNEPKPKWNKSKKKKSFPGNVFWFLICIIRVNKIHTYTHT